MQAIGVFENGKLKVFSKFIQGLKDFRDSNEGRKILMEYTVLATDASQDTKIDIYYKTVVLPCVRDLLKKDIGASSLTIAEVDFALRYKFMAINRNTPLTVMTTAKSYEDLSTAEKLGFISNISIWLYKTYKVQMEKI